MKVLYALFFLVPFSVALADCEGECKEAEVACVKFSQIGPFALGNMCQEDYNRCAALCRFPTTLPLNKANSRLKAII